ncbi:MAG: HAD domain-containing protein [Pseudomonadota bacterium]
MHLFLDYDGPMHPDAVYVIKGKITLKADGIALFEHAPVLEELLEPHPHVKIVLSTSWVRILGFDRAKHYLPAELQRRVVGATFHREMNRDHPGRFASITRFEQINQYVRRHNLERWIALDNDAVGWPDELRRHLVHVDDWAGLSDPDAQKQLSERLKVDSRLHAEPRAKDGMVNDGGTSEIKSAKDGRDAF